MKGIYKTKEGSKVEVLDFDEANKIAMIKISDTQNKWVDESEYSTWTSENEESPVFEESPDGENVDEVQKEVFDIKPKRIRKKKEE